jgi:hypothetical protein
MLGDLGLGRIEDRNDPLEAGLAAGVDDEVEHRPAAHGVENLRLGRTESSAKAGG